MEITIRLKKQIKLQLDFHKKSLTRILKVEEEINLKFNECYACYNIQHTHKTGRSRNVQSNGQLYKTSLRE